MESYVSKGSESERNLGNFCLRCVLVLWNQTCSKRKKRERIRESSNSSKALTLPPFFSLCPSSLNEAELKM